MNRRAFLRQSGIAALGLAALPVATAMRLWAGPAHAEPDAVGNDLDSYPLTEEDVIQLTLNYADSYKDVLPGVNIRESLLNRLLKDRDRSRSA